MRVGVRIGVAAVALLTAPASSVWAWEAGKPDDPAAHAAARTAVKALGPDRGGLATVADTRPLLSEARLLASEVRDVGGLGLGLKAT